MTLADVYCAASFCRLLSGVPFMKLVLPTATALLALATAAHAADLPRKAPVFKAPAMQVYDWTGFYLGANAGLGVGRNLTRSTIGPAGAPLLDERAHLSPFGAIGGAQIGYNWQFRNFYDLVLGVEADIQASGQRDNFACLIACTPVVATQTFSQSIDWFGTVRGRVGLATGPVLTYVTGGYAYGRVNTSSTAAIGAGPVTLASTQNRDGFVLGSGVEAQLGGNWTGKLEYLYVDLGTQNVAGTIAATPFTGSSRIRDHVFRGGVNYLFGNNAGYVAPVANWNGFYLGGNVGSILGRDRSNHTLPAAPQGISYTLVPEGIIGGGQVGYNWQAGAWVFGLEADYQGTSAKDNKACTLFCTAAAGFGVQANQTLPWLATVRGRIGYSVGSTLFYATGGYAHGSTRTTLTEAFAAGSVATTIRSTRGGYAVGAGIESPLQFAGLFGPNWTTKTEYLYVDLGRTTAAFTTPNLGAQTFTTRTQEHIFRTGINYHFSPVATTRY